MDIVDIFVRSQQDNCQADEQELTQADEMKHQLYFT